MIRITPIRVIGADGEQVGVIETAQALRMAEEAGLDLVEISPDARPPVCKIMDHGKFKYEQSKKDQKNKSSSKASEMKEVRLGRSVKIDPHDVSIRVAQARRFLLDGHKVLITQKFKGREMAHRELGVNRLQEIMKSLSDISKCESSPRWMGPQASIILAPDKAKCDAYKRANKPAKVKDKDKDKEREKDSDDAKDGPKPAPAQAAGPSQTAPAVTSAPPAAPSEPSPA
jgi:translation initiation factor IF-3